MIVLKIFLYLALPILALLSISPMVSNMPPFYGPDNIYQILIVIPFYLGLLAAPGYIWALNSIYGNVTPGKKATLFIKVSLWVSLIAGIGGTTTILAVIPFPFVIGSITCSIILLIKFK